MGCNVCKKVDSLDITSDQPCRKENKQNEKGDENPNECQYTQINISSIYMMGNKASNMKGKVKPEDREKIALGVQSKFDTERNTIREIVKMETPNQHQSIEENQDKNFIVNGQKNNPTIQKCTNQINKNEEDKNKKSTSN